MQLLNTYLLAFNALILRAMGWPVVAFYNRFLSGQAKTHPEAIVTLPNLISVSRIVFAGLVWHWHGSTMITFWLLMAAMYSDLADGVLAREMGITSSGAMIDPTCDKIFFAVFATAFKDSFGSVFWVSLVIEFLIFAVPATLVGLRVVKANKDNVKANIAGKTKFTMQCLALMAVLLGLNTLATTLLWAACPMAIMSVVQKVKEVFKTS